jgi:SPP1 gp7 family putative phage head morphogenesis protein
MKPLKFKEASEWAKKRKVILPDVYYSEQNKKYRTLTFSIAGISNINLLSDTLNSLVDAIDNGILFDEWKKEASEKLLLPNHRLSTIYHTNIQSAYNSGIYQRQAENKELNPIYMYSAINDSRTRPDHAKWNGYLARYDSPFWSTHTPSCGYNCRCRRLAMSEAKAILLGYGKQKTPEGMPDNGFDYDKTLGLKKGLERAKNNAKENIYEAENALRKKINPNSKNKNSIIWTMFSFWLSLKN